MLQKLQDHLQQNFPFLKGKKILTTVSGGVDSIVLTHLFKQLDYNIAIAHCNFQLRDAESDLDEAFVENTAKELNCKLHKTKFSTTEYCQENKVNTQIGARELRYNWFHELCAEFNYDFVLTAHHLNDVMETFFINLSRGTGLDGLAGIPPINKNIIRPLLVFPRTDIINFAKENNIEWREDQSNAETKYLRNKIRHNITPELYKLHPNFETNFLKSIQLIYESRAFINTKIELLRKVIFTPDSEDFMIKKEDLLNLSEFETYHLFKPFGFTSVIEIIKLLKTQTGKQIHSTTHTLLNNREEFILSKKTNPTHGEAYTINDIDNTKHLPIQLELTTKKRELSKKCIAIDTAEIDFPLTLRKWKNGDYFYPLGMNGKKKISKFLKDEKLSLREKENTWVLCNHENEIIWVIGRRSSQLSTSKVDKESTIFIDIK